jgi:hypothetical protein
MLLTSRHIELTTTLCLDKTGGHQDPDQRGHNMAGPPSHPDTGITGQDPGPARTVRPRWKTAAIAVIVIAVLTVMVILHLTRTLGAGTHG